MKATRLITAISCGVAIQAWCPTVAADLTGEQVVKAQCIKCHGSGLNGAPKIGDREAWIPRLKNGLDPLVHKAIRGHDNMPARGGMAQLTDAEFKDAVIYLFRGGNPP